MSSIAAGIGVGLVGAKMQSDAIGSAAAGQERAAGLSLAELKRQFDLGQNNMAPWMRAGRKALTEQEALMGLGGDTEGAMAALRNSPGYTSRLNQGQRSLDSGLASRGGMGSGKAMTAASGWNQDFASNEYGNRLSQLAGLSGQGQSSAAGMAGMGQNYAQNASNVWQGNANAQGAAGIGSANAWQSGLTGGLGLGANMYDYLNNKNLTSSLSFPSLKMDTSNW